MGSLLQCILRTCFDDEEKESRNESYEPPSPVPVATRMTRHSPSSYQSGIHEGEEGVDDTCCHQNSSASEVQVDSQFPSLHDFFRLLKDRWRKYDFVEATDSQDDTITVANSESSLLTTQDLIEPGRPFGMIRRSSSGDANKNRRPKILPPSPLRTALSYDKSREVPSIRAEEVVLPGSELQKQMAQSMADVLEAQGDECVICMEPFDSSNPRMPTLCGCGENKTYFHLPCLYQWIEQSRHCPSCRQLLRWEEF